jgi:hypothetical protein
MHRLLSRQDGRYQLSPFPEDIAMMKRLMRWAGIAAMTVLTACATVPEGAPPFSPAPVAPAGYATVYVYRLGAPPYTRDIKVSLAGKAVLNAPERAYTWLFVPAGTHTLLAEWPTDFLGPKRWPDAAITERLEAGESYYFRVAGNVGIAPGGFFSSGGMVLSSQILRRPPDAGIAELVACCRFLSPATERLQ